MHIHTYIKFFLIQDRHKSSLTFYPIKFSIKKFGYICKTKANIHIYKKGS